MARPRTPSNVLNLRGTFTKNPKRKREDARGNKPFGMLPPVHLPKEHVSAWQDIVQRLPLVALYNTDEIIVELAAAGLYAVRHAPVITDENGYEDAGAIAKEQRMARAALVPLLVQLGMTPAARTKIPMQGDGEAEGNPFADV